MTHADAAKLTVDAPTMPRWVPRVLNAAAIYNILCGAFVVVFPTLPFQLAGMQLPNYPAIVQCLGMVIGVYGVGYALAARNPIERWPLVVVGLLGKVLGPIGFVYAAWTGEFPLQVGLMIVTNDLIWWLPFTAILVHVIRIRDSRRSDIDNVTLADLLRQVPARNGVSLYDCSRDHDLLVVCVRHSGCTYCREALDDLARQRSAIERSGARPVVVHMGTSAEGEAMLRRYGCEDFEQISDPTRRVYHALQLRLGTLTELFGIRAFWRALIEGTIFRFGFGRIVGNGLQMPGAFLIRDGEVVKAYRHESSADRPNYADMACSLH